MDRIRGWVAGAQSDVPPAPGTKPTLASDGRWDGRHGAPAAASVGGEHPTPPAALALPEQLGHLLRHPVQRPEVGLRARVYDLTGGRVNLGLGAKEARQRALVERARTPIADPPTFVAVVSAKGGVGKTTGTLCLTWQLGTLRGSHTIAVECNPHAGTFRSRMPVQHSRTVQDLLDHLRTLRPGEDLTRPMLYRYTTDVADGGFEILTAPTDPAARQALDEADYRRVFTLLERHFDVLTLDLGTGLLDPAAQFMLGQLADQVVVVVPAAQDGAELGAHTLQHVASLRGRRAGAEDGGLDWLKQHAVVAINMVGRDSLIDRRALRRHFSAWARDCVEVPWDQTLAAGGRFDWRRLSSGVHDAYLKLAAAVADGFSEGGR